MKIIKAFLTYQIWDQVWFSLKVLSKPIKAIAGKTKISFLIEWVETEAKRRKGKVLIFIWITILKDTPIKWIIRMDLITKSTVLRIKINSIFRVKSTQTLWIESHPKVIVNPANIKSFNSQFSSQVIEILPNFRKVPLIYRNLSQIQNWYRSQNQYLDSKNLRADLRSFIIMKSSFRIIMMGQIRWKAYLQMISWSGK